MESHLGTRHTRKPHSPLHGGHTMSNRKDALRSKFFFKVLEINGIAVTFRHDSQTLKLRVPPTQPVSNPAGGNAASCQQWARSFYSSL